MNIEEQLQELAQQSCPRQVDVVDAVMEEVRQHPYLITAPAQEGKLHGKSRPLWIRNTAISSAAAVIILFVAGITIFLPRTTNHDDQIGSMLAYVSDYDSYYSPVESAATEPYTYLYNEYAE